MAQHRILEFRILYLVFSKILLIFVWMFKTDVGYKSFLPFPEFFTGAEAVYHSCSTFIIISSFLGATLLMASGFLCFLTSRLHKTVVQAHTSNLDTVIKEHHHKYGVKKFLHPSF